MTVATFDPALAAEKAARAIRDRFAEIRDQAEAETMSALAGVERYAKHLADGGDPREGFDRPKEYRTGTKYVSPTVYLEQVWEEWNEARGARNPFSPISHLQDYEIGEFALARVGEPILYATFQEEISATHRRSMQSDDVARALAACQGDDLVLRRTKVGGKVAYLLRERQEGEEFVGRRHEGSRINVSLFATNVPEERWTT